MTTPTSARPTSPQYSATGSLVADQTAPESDIGIAASDSRPNANSRDGMEDTTGSSRAGTVNLQPPTGKVQGLTGPVGEAGLPPSRPSSMATAMSSKTGRSQTASRASRGSKRGPGSVGGVRPPSSASKTHVPSLTSHAFFKPLSSERLQAQRGQRPNSISKQRSLTRDGPVEGGEGWSNSGSKLGVRSPRGTEDNDGPPPPSRETEFSENDVPDRGTANTTPTGVETIRSKGDSVTPLYKPVYTVPENEDLAPPATTAAGTNPAQKSPRSFRSSFILPSIGTNQAAARSQGHEKLSSGASSPRLAPEEEVKEDIRRNLGKNHEYFEGNTVFWFGGRMQNTRDRPVNIGTGLMVMIPSVLFFIFSAPWLWLNISPAIPILFGYLFLICISSFIHASVTNPGILPRNLHPFPPPSGNEDPLALGPPTTEWTMVLSTTSTTAAMEVPTKYCKSCNIWRPPRAHHCRTCDNCVENQDHHCVWLNNCVGRRNYRYFFTFVSACTLSGLYLLGASLAHILVWRAREDASFGDAINRWRVPFAMVIYGLIFTAYPASLWGYHLFLVGRAETTREYLNSHKFAKKDRHRPFTQGNIWKNWVVVFFRPRPPTYLNFKREYEEGDQRYGPRRGRKAADQLDPEHKNGGLEMQDVVGKKSTFQGPSAVDPINRTPRPDVPLRVPS